MLHIRNPQTSSHHLPHRSRLPVAWPLPQYLDPASSAALVDADQASQPAFSLKPIYFNAVRQD